MLDIARPMPTAETAHSGSTSQPEAGGRIELTLRQAPAPSSTVTFAPIQQSRPTVMPACVTPCSRIGVVRSSIRWFSEWKVT